MDSKRVLERKIKELKLVKRDLVLAGKNTSKIDEEIKLVERQLNDLVVPTK